MNLLGRLFFMSCHITFAATAEVVLFGLDVFEKISEWSE